jgi:hypothetical protein
MLRSLLVGVLALSTASGCKGSSDAPAVQPGVAVGKVVTIAGAVTATRGSDKRSLAVGQDVSGDDVIETSADASVRIQFAHNHALWDLGPNRKQLVSESLAWKAPTSDTPAAKVDETTLAAGRHAERETVTTNETAPPAASAPAAPMAPSGGAAPGGPPPTAQPQMDRAKGGESGAAMDDERAPDPKQEKAAPPKAMVERGAVRRPEPDDSNADDKRPPLAATKAITPELAVKQAFDAQRAALLACLEGATAKLSIAVANGHATLALPSKTSDKTAACFRKVAAQLTFPSSYELTISYSLVR